MKRLRTLRPALLIVLLGLTVFWWQRETNRRLASELTTRRIALRDLSHLPGESQRLRDLLATPDPAHATEQVKAQIARLRQEIAQHEPKRAAQPPRPSGVTKSPAARPSGAPSADQDFVRIADHQNVGQATPGAAFQTLVWAVAHDEVAALSRVIHLTPAGEQRLQQQWRELSPESQARFERPERIMMLLLALDVLDEEGFRISGETTGPTGEMVLRVSRFKHGRLQGEKRIPMHSGPAGWQIALPDHTIAEIPQAIAQASLYVPPREAP